MKAFVTGGSGFIGRHLIRQLIEKGYDVYALARSPQSIAIIEKLGAVPVPGDITDTESMRDGMTGSDVVFHIAAWYKIGSPDIMRAETINVGGTRKVLRLAHELGIPKIIYTSTVAVFGDTKGQLVDETYYQGGPFLSEYDRTKWLAHYKVAIPLIEKGAPIIIVMPGAVYGPGDTSLVAEVMRFFYRGMPAIPGPETTLAYAHVEDIAAGHILAAEKGKIGESYILTGPAIPTGEMIDFWAYLTGKPASPLRIPHTLLHPFAPLMSTLQPALHLPTLFSGEAISLLGATYMARADKARAELGWETRPLQTGMLETFAWIAETEAQHSLEQQPEREKRIAGLALLSAALLSLYWLLGRKKD
ncbi:MAG: NAD-dependent epimerase/dehydratase family protein [Anaerolineales bacterium]|nr:NAD-dependent epimerase/dehydratase family protein [Anaerolineales bacterium]MCB8990002.1 NAD-dependent epimerase/dehydratase family protein [Ardenticatenaceae bacterium]